ncbi:type II CRISPR RNA-guided endonuclease Cas9 [Comamonadaceae bacterium M7527]|nr:type II CRISPR RNA-guided endonuclease Cas9 [Comamonadaceae bacterium M7527]
MSTAFFKKRRIYGFISFGAGYWGQKSIGWAILGLDAYQHPKSIIRAGSRIFGDGRDPKSHASLAVGRREARLMRRRRDRFLQRRSKLMNKLIEHGFFPQDEQARRALANLNPYELRHKGLSQELTPNEFARAVFHLNQRRGFQSNRKSASKDENKGAMKEALLSVRQQLSDGQHPTVGAWLWHRVQCGEPPRARYREDKVPVEGGKTKTVKSYDLYIDRAMVKEEFEALWDKQVELRAGCDAGPFSPQAHAALFDAIFYQRPLRPVKPGRCTLLPDQERAPLALPSQQLFRIYQEVNNLRVLDDRLDVRPLTLQERDVLVDVLRKAEKGRASFSALAKKIKLPRGSTFNLEDDKRKDLKGDAARAAMIQTFGAQWDDLSLAEQDQLVSMLLADELKDEDVIAWLQQTHGLDGVTAERVLETNLPEGYGRLSKVAIDRILPELQQDVITYDKAVVAAGFDSHSATTGEIMDELPYYGKYMQARVAFGTGIEDDPDEQRYGKVANPTVHVALNQVRVVVNALIKRYGRPDQVVIEVANDLKKSAAERAEDQKRQADNQKRNQRIRNEIADLLGTEPDLVKRADVQKWILWEELSRDATARRCPYSGTQISARMLFDGSTEVDHILPFKETLDDSLNNKVVCMRLANRIKAKRTPWEARQAFEAQGWIYDDILQRVALMPNRHKRKRFAEDGYQQWLGEEGNDFLARALNDTRHAASLAREYLTLICPENDTWVVPGKLTGMLRGFLGLNDVLGLDGEKNRDDHRHHAVDACVIGITDRRTLWAFATANARADERGMDRLIDTFEPPWPTYKAHVARAVASIKVSHKPDHGYQGAMFTGSIYSSDGKIDQKKKRQSNNGKGEKPKEDKDPSALELIHARNDTVYMRERHGVVNGELKPYKGLFPQSNYCMVILNNNGMWCSHAISTFEAYQIAKHAKCQDEALKVINRHIQNLGDVVMVIRKGDYVWAKLKGHKSELYVAQQLAKNGDVVLVCPSEADADARDRKKEGGVRRLMSKSARMLQKTQARYATVSPIGDVRIHK